MLLVQTTLDRITGILEKRPPIALVPAENRDTAKKIAVAARDGGFGVSDLWEPAKKPKEGRPAGKWRKMDAFREPMKTSQAQSEIAESARAIKTVPRGVSVVISI